MFISDIDQITGRTLIVDEDDNACWAYITKPTNKDIDVSCWLYNRIPHPVRTDIDKYVNSPPPAPIEFLKDGCPVYEEMDEDRITWRWSVTGETVCVYLDGEVLALLRADTGEVYNKFLKKDCPWGKPLGQ